MFIVDLSTRECDGHVVVALRGELDLVDAADVARKDSLRLQLWETSCAKLCWRLGPMLSQSRRASLT